MKRWIEEYRIPLIFTCIIFQNNHIEFIEEVPKIIRGQEGRGIKLRIADGSHFNEAAHRVCGQILSERLKKTVEICGKKRGQPLF